MNYAEYRHSIAFGILALLIAIAAIAVALASSSTGAWLILAVSILAVLYILWRKKRGLQALEDMSDEGVKAWQRFMKLCGALYFLMMLIVGVLAWKSGVTVAIKVLSVALIAGIYVLMTAASLGVAVRYSESD